MIAFHVHANHLVHVFLVHGTSFVYLESSVTSITQKHSTKQRGGSKTGLGIKLGEPASTDFDKQVKWRASKHKHEAQIPAAQHSRQGAKSSHPQSLMYTLAAVCRIHSSKHTVSWREFPRTRPWAEAGVGSPHFTCWWSLGGLQHEPGCRGWQPWSSARPRPS